MVGTLELNHIFFTIRQTIHVISFVYRLQAVLFSSKIREKECKTSKRANVTVSVTLERWRHEPLVAWALGDVQFSHLPMPMLLVARGVAGPRHTLSMYSQSRLYAYLFCILFHGFSRKGETARSLLCLLQGKNSLPCRHLSRIPSPCEARRALGVSLWEAKKTRILKSLWKLVCSQ